jgi:hypothetical protein
MTQNGEQLGYKYFTFASFPIGSSLLKLASDLKNRYFSLAFTHVCEECIQGISRHMPLNNIAK